MGWPTRLCDVLTTDQQHLSHYSLGNPHVVTYQDLHIQHRQTLASQWVQLGDRGVNVSFARQVEDLEIELHVYERGCGWTMACGTGACATVFDGYQNGLFKNGDSVAVRLPGGQLTIEITDDGLLMWGPAREVYTGYFTATV